MKRIVVAGALAGLGIALVAAFAFRGELVPERSPAERGRRAAQAAGCFGCHGPSGAEGAPNQRRSPDGKSLEEESVPPLTSGDNDAAALRQWVRNGISDAEAASPINVAARSRKLLQMPAYAGRLSDGDIEDIVSWLSLEACRASGEAALEPPTGPSGPELPLARGERLARTWGCFACHGELGQGGVGNAGALKGYIPGFFGRDFELLTQGGEPDSVREWIRDGAARAFIEGRIAGIRLAAWFTERQAIQMPAYGLFAPAADIDALVEYVGAIHRLGPLDAKGIEDYLAKQKRKDP
ncbi:MAG TPA: c-type cytochrome [Planctomycetota bacterium]|nr:c-type cytochrome [Planctomycetota bacterium]